MTEPHDEIQLVLRLKEGDERAQRELFDRLYEPVRTHVLAARLARNDDDALEIAQETFVRAYRDIAAFQGRSTLKTWIISLSRHASIDYYRVSRNRYDAVAEPRPLMVREAETTHAADAADPSPSPLETLIAKRNCDQVRRALAQLDEDQRNVIIYRRIDGLSTAEAAILLERSESAVKMLLLRAMQKLHSVLKAEGCLGRLPRERGGGPA